MVVLETVCVAFAMFSALPVPHVDWNERNMRYAMAAFPLVGAVIGALWCVCGLLPLPDMLKAAGCVRWRRWLSFGGIAPWRRSSSAALRAIWRAGFCSAQSLSCWWHC